MNVDVDRSADQAARALPQSDAWTRGRALDSDRALVTPRALPYSLLAECECPDDCLRDHENE